MQPPAQTSNLWTSVGNGTAVSFVAPALSETAPRQAAQQVLPPSQPRIDQECVLRHVGSDPYLTNRGPLSADELRYTTLVQLKNLPPGQAPPSWLTYVVKPIKAGVVDQGGPAPAAATGSGSLTAATTCPAAAPASSPSGDVLRHPDPNVSVEELRWRDYQALKQNQAPVAGAASAPAGLPLPAGAPLGPSLLAPSASSAAPNTPIFPTPVRTLFPPTPPAAVAPGAMVEGAMDTSDAPDAEQFFQCMYVSPANAVASPEEMRIVQVESYKAGKQIMPYWMLSGA